MKMRKKNDTAVYSTGTKVIRFLVVLLMSYVADAQKRYLAYAPTIQEFKREIAKAAVAGAFFGVIVEVAVYAGVQVSGKKERNFEG